MKIFVNTSLDKENEIAGIGIYVIDEKNNTQTISQYYKTNNIDEAELWSIYQASILGHGKESTIYTNSEKALKYIQNEIKDIPETKEQYIQAKKLKYLSYQIKKLNSKVEYIHKSKNPNELVMGNIISNYLTEKGKDKYSSNSR